MPHLGRHRVLRVAVILLYALATLMLGSVRHDAVASAVAASASDLQPDDSGFVICKHEAGDHGQPDDGAPADHGCCDSCLLMHAPGLGSVEGPVLAHPPARRIAHGAPLAPSPIVVRRAAPSSRGPPVA